MKTRINQFGSDIELELRDKRFHATIHHNWLPFLHLQLNSICNCFVVG